MQTACEMLGCDNATLLLVCESYYVLAWLCGITPAEVNMLIGVGHMMMMEVSISQ